MIMTVFVEDLNTETVQQNAVYYCVCVRACVTKKQQQQKLHIFGVIPFVKLQNDT